MRPQHRQDMADKCRHIRLEQERSLINRHRRDSSLNPTAGQTRFLARQCHGQRQRTAQSCLRLSRHHNGWLDPLDGVYLAGNVLPAIAPSDLLQRDLACVGNGVRLCSRSPSLGHGGACKPSQWVQRHGGCTHQTGRGCAAFRVVGLRLRELGHLLLG